jgi:acyl-CoA synthetase (AMP-forming)/AMP-acid ligase II
MCVMPLFHVNGQIVTVMTPLYHGGSTVIPKKFSVTRFFPLIHKYGVTYVGSVATMLSMLLNKAAFSINADESSLKIVFCGSAPVPVKVQVEFEKTFKVPVIEGYGMTETTCRSTFNPLPPPEVLQLGKSDGYRKIGSVGIPLGNEIRVLDESHNPLGPNEVGEIVIRGENVMKGYYKNAEATEKAFTEGWFHSGDLGYYDEEGYFFIIDRKNDMIIRGGENIYPREIEELLYKHPAVKDAACIGVPDELYGEEVVAFITLKENKKAEGEEIVSFCSQFLADFKCPKQIIIMEEIPKSSSGKLLRRELREIWNRNS